VRRVLITKKFLLLFSKRSAFFCSFLKKRTKKLLFILVQVQPVEAPGAAAPPAFVSLRSGRRGGL
jgi:hypothetical protein